MALSDTEKRERRIKRTGMAAGALAISMVGAGFAAVPLYQLFCQVTGYGGTTQVADSAQAAMLKPTGDIINIRFDSNVHGIPWDFRPEERTQKIEIGAKKQAFFLADNQASEANSGQAGYNVAPEQVGKYFNKIECFCFTQQTLKPGEHVRMPVIYFIDPEIRNDPDTKDIEEITLSYTFYPLPNK